jgi:hypothetical protein
VFASPEKVVWFSAALDIEGPGAVTMRSMPHLSPDDRAEALARVNAGRAPAAGGGGGGNPFMAYVQAEGRRRQAAASPARSAPAGPLPGAPPMRQTPRWAAALPPEQRARAAAARARAVQLIVRRKPAAARRLLVANGWPIAIAESYVNRLAQLRR